MGGSATIESLGSKTTIRQSTDRAIIKWHSFDVQNHEHVDFQQPSRSSITLNRIEDVKPSQIDGKITANGNIMLLNPNGIVFGAGSQIDVGALVASTSDIEDDAAFLAGGDVKLTKPGKVDAKIIHHGQITTTPGGLAGFVAPQVENYGIIQASLGKVQLASGDVSTLDFAGDGLIQIAISDAVEEQLVKNTGTIEADGGHVLMTAAVARDLVESLIVNEGRIQANTYGINKGLVNVVNETGSFQNTGAMHAKGDDVKDGGDITIQSDFTALGGDISVDGHNGGTIEIVGNTISLSDQIFAKGLTEKGGLLPSQPQLTSGRLAHQNYQQTA